MKLNIGCGQDIRPGYINLDIFPLPGVDVVHDLNSLPLPFADNEFDEIMAKDIIEHLDYIPVLKDLHRILRPGGRLIILSPHYTSTNCYSDPTHRHCFAVRTLSFFCRKSPYLKSVDRSYYFDFHFSSIKAAITFPRHFGPLSVLNAKLVNIHPKVQVLYELTAWAGLFPAENVRVELTK